MLRIISGKWRQQKLKLPSVLTTRPTTDRVKESLFNILAHHYHLQFEGLKVADLFAGSGILGLECLSRGAQDVCFIENNFSVLKILKENIQVLKAEQNCQIVKTTLPELPICAEAKDLIFLDPPYQKNLIQPTCVELQKMGWVKNETLICVESSLKDIPSNLLGLNCDQQRRYGQSSIGFWKTI